ncbi:ankyrin repeat-containing protein [Tanacetum coccineum]|uniref:Ankyrin repeat-containing protein n=1 Tax=Tanacetum coccineum TaxID=301880 RepID=A0ABQ5BQA9_9ASTR
MEGEALSWYRWSEGRTPFQLWDGFKRRLLIRFQHDKRELYSSFLAITQGKNRLEHMFALTTVRVMNPEGLNNAMELAVLIEENNYTGVIRNLRVSLQSDKPLLISSDGKGYRVNRLWEGVGELCSTGSGFELENPWGGSWVMEPPSGFDSYGPNKVKDIWELSTLSTTKGITFKGYRVRNTRKKAKGHVSGCEEKYTPCHRCASRTLQVMLVDESDEAEEPDLNFKSWDRGSKND